MRYRKDFKTLLPSILYGRACILAYATISSILTVPMPVSGLDCTCLQKALFRFWPHIYLKCYLHLPTASLQCTCIIAMSNRTRRMSSTNIPITTVFVFLLYTFPSTLYTPWNLDGTLSPWMTFSPCFLQTASDCWLTHI